jgi:hypothetical protein
MFLLKLAEKDRTEAGSRTKFRRFGGGDTAEKTFPGFFIAGWMKTTKGKGYYSLFAISSIPRTRDLAASPAS